MRWVFRVLGSLAVLALLAVAALFLIPTETVARLASAQIEKMTGRTLTLEGSVRPTVWPQLGVRTGAVTLANADWSEAGPMLQAEGLAVSVDMAALIGGTVRVTGIDLVEPQLLLERARDGRVNWDLAATPGTEAATPGTETAATQATEPAVAEATPFTIDRATIRGGSLLYIDHATGQEVALRDIDLDAAIPDFEGAAEVTASAVMNGQTFDLKGTVGAFGPFLDGKVVPVALTGTAAKSDVAFDGRMGLSPLAGEGQLEATLNDPAAVFALLGQAAPDLPAGLGRNRIALSGVATLTAEGSMHLREGTIGLDDNSFAGAFDLVQGKARPKLTAQLTTGALNLAALGGTSGGGASGDGGAGGGGGTPATGWSTAPIDASGLSALDAAVTLAADSVDFGSVEVGRTRLGVTVDAARAVVDLREVAAYGGTLAGQVIVNARKGLSARADLALKGLALEPLLKQVAGTDRLLGTGDLRFNVLGSGGTMDAMMRSLAGEGSLAFRQGELRGVDLAGMIRTLNPGYAGDGSTVFDSLTGSFTVAGGVLSNGDLALAAPLLTASGAGTVDLGGQTLDYRLIPLTLAGKALDTDVQVPVLVSGPWAAPQVRLDLETLARRKFEEEAKKLEEKARAEIAQKLQEETGVVPLDGESLEDTARRAAEQALQDEASRALERLLGGGGSSE